ncbi:pyruvate dehydrogenase (acetyl-transferring) E1 component, alpha subunit [mine drainage metagenome]|uniref:Pyruvate dehydrogenase (Acetyl-transferring) E1 component, alpha subunit n=1 Tax=mine drainage metagenome TaxID=410659 RepID=T0Z440_9ZZZZ
MARPEAVGPPRKGLCEIVAPSAESVMANAALPPDARASPGELDLPSSAWVAAYRTMVLARAMDERCLSLQRQGRIGFYVPLEGQEAAQVGCALALDAKDWVFPAYRELGVALVRGVPIQELLDQFIGNSGDRLKGRQMPNHYGYRAQNFVVASSPLGTQIPQAVGAALAARRRGDPIVTVAFFGDGSTSTNDFHAGLNFAGVFRSPTIFFCQNNQWAISMPRSRQTMSPTLAEKAEAYGFRGVVVDGTDLGQVYREVAQARARALAGEGPTLLEAQVYRFGPHSTSDDPKRYRSDPEVAEWRRRDPLLRTKERIMKDGGWTEEQDAALWTEVRNRIAEAWKAAEATPPLPPTSFLEDVFSTPTPQLQIQRGEVESLLERKVIHE